MNIVFRQLCHILIKKQPRTDTEFPKVTLAEDNGCGRRDSFIYTVCKLLRVSTAEALVSCHPCSEGTFGDTEVQVAFIFLQ